MGAAAVWAEQSRQRETKTRPAWYHIFSARQLVNRNSKILFYKTMT
jgi:hypothetical protein